MKVKDFRTSREITNRDPISISQWQNLGTKFDWQSYKNQRKVSNFEKD